MIQVYLDRTFDDELHGSTTQNWADRTGKYAMQQQWTASSYSADSNHESWVQVFSFPICERFYYTGRQPYSVPLNWWWLSLIFTYPSTFTGQERQPLPHVTWEYGGSCGSMHSDQIWYRYAPRSKQGGSIALLLGLKSIYPIVEMKTRPW